MQTPWKQTSAHNTVHDIRHTIQSNNTGDGRSVAAELDRVYDNML